MNYSKFSTKSIHTGQEPDKQTGAICIPITLSTTYLQSSPGVFNKYEYSRTSNPTRVALEKCFAAMENAKYGHAFASGSVATTTLIHLLPFGSHIVSIDDVYGGVYRLFNNVVKDTMNLKIDMIDFDDDGKYCDIITSDTKMIWLETPTNPTLKMVDIKKIVNTVKSKYPDIIIVVDNTFATPYFQKPLDLGADIVMHSGTKYLNGHSDVVSGLIATNNEEISNRISYLSNCIGGVPAPFDCYMILRGMKTLKIRMEEHQKNALIIAKYLDSHDKVEKVIYPGLPSHPNYDIFKKQMSGFGGMISILLKADLSNTRKFLENLHLIKLAESLGSVETLIEHPGIMTHASISYEKRIKLGILDNLVRLSVGIEDVDDLIDDLSNSLKLI